MQNVIQTQPCPACRPVRARTSEARPCPACGATQHRSTPVGGVVECALCGALHGTCTLGESYHLIPPVFSRREAQPDELRPYDLEIVGPDGIGRRHGWYDIETGAIAQIG